LLDRSERYHAQLGAGARIFFPHDASRTRRALRRMARRRAALPRVGGPMNTRKTWSGREPQPKKKGQKNGGRKNVPARRSANALVVSPFTIFEKGDRGIMEMLRRCFRTGQMTGGKEELKRRERRGRRENAK